MNSHNSHMCQHEVNHNWNLFFFLISINKYGRTIFWMILPCIEKILKNFIFSQPGIGSLPNPSWYQHGFWAYCNFFVRNSWGILGVKQLKYHSHGKTKDWRNYYVGSDSDTDILARKVQIELTQWNTSIWH